MRRPQTKVVYDDNSDEEDDNLSYRSEEDELLNDNPSSDLEEEEALGNDSDYLGELPDDDDASYCTESSFRSHSTLGSTPGTVVCKCTHQSRFAILKSVHFIFSPVQEPSRIVQNGACTQKQAFVYRVLCSPLACRIHASTGSRVFDFCSIITVFLTN